uniref:Uncharacterized protein n=1 Tax=Romanomermis culicivorax TaxID=13658 RepID=A0A915IZ91_ROMCU
MDENITVILHTNEQERINCLSYYAPLQSVQTESFLIFSFVTRTLAILINLASIVQAKLVHHKRIFIITGSTNGGYTETIKVFIDYVKIVIWLETCVGMPYSILREITLSMNLSDFVFMHVLTVSIFTDSMFGAVEPLVIDGQGYDLLEPGSLVDLKTNKMRHGNRRLSFSSIWIKQRRRGEAFCDLNKLPWTRQEKLKGVERIKTRKKKRREEK